jgi:hypothetical protein
MDIFDKVLSVSGMFEKFFGKLLPDLVYHKTAENYKQLLTEMYGFVDIHRIFKKQLIKNDTLDLTKIIFKYQDMILQKNVESNKN